MEVPVENPAAEIKRLQRCINDLVSVLALGAKGRGEPSEIVRTLFDALLGMLDLDLIYGRVNHPASGEVIEMVRASPSRNLPAQPQEIGKLIDRWLGVHPQEWPPLIRNRIGDGDISILPMRLGLQGEIGIIVAGSQRADFPKVTERLLLSVAANQAAIGLQDARILSEHKRITNELDQQVTQRTKELAEANEELKKEVAERRLAEERLRQEERELKRSEARKAAILNSALDCIVTIDHESRITEFNPAAERTFGYSRNQVVGKQLADVIIPAPLRDEHRRGFARYLATGDEQLLGRHLEMTMVRQDGSEFLAELAITRIPLEGPPSFTGFLRDITKRKKREEDLREAHAHVARNEERWRSVFENSAIGVALTDLNGRFIATNPVYQKMLGYDEEELRNLTFLDITKEKFQEENRTLIDELLAGKRRQFQIEKQYCRKDGTLVWVRNNVSLVPGGERVPQFIMALSEDITERKRTEDKLRRSEAFLTEAQRLSRTGSFFWRVATDEIAWSEQLYRIYEFDLGVPLTVEFIRSRAHPEDVPILNEVRRKAQGTGTDFEHEHRLLMPDRSVKYLHVIGRVMRDEDGQMEYVGAMQDVTQRRLSEDALGKARSELAHVSRILSLGALTASIAHEVNQPLAAIVTNANACLRWLDRATPDLEEARNAIQRIIRDGIRGSEVIGRIRLLLKKEQSPRTRMNINETVGEMVRLAQFELDGIDLQMELTQPLPCVFADRVQLQQVLLNLMLNAIDAMKSVSDRPRVLRLETRRDGNDTVLVGVEDSGVGLQPEKMEKLFQTFYTTKSGGLGMGLSISRSIIEDHGGRLWAKSNEGPGATFQFTLPVENGEPT